MDAQAVKKTILAAKRFLNAHGPPKDKDVNEVLAEAKKFLKENKNNPDRETWIDNCGQIVEFPLGTHKNYKPGEVQFL